MIPHPPTHSSPEPGPFDAILGERIDDLAEFSAGLTAGTLSEETVRTLFDLTAGHISLARTVVSGAQRARVALDAVAAEDYSTLLAPFSLDAASLDWDSPAVRLFLLVAQVETIEAPLIALAHRAIPRIGEAPDDAVPSADELTSQLVFTGVLSLCPKHAGSYVMPGLIRAVARRIGPNPPEGRISPRQALGLELEESHRSLLDVGTVRPDALLALIGDLGAWSLLTEVWSERGFNVFYPEFVAAVHTILSVPASVVRGSLVLAEAQSAAREIANISNRTGSTDPREVLPLVTFDRLDVPTLEQERARLDDGDFTADEVAVMTLRTMRDRRQHGDLDGAVAAAEAGMELIFARQSGSGSLSRLYDARLLMERGLDLARTGDVRRGLHLVERAVVIAESILPFEPFPLLPSLAVAAVGYIAAGFGPKSEQVLSRYDELRARFEFHTLQTDYIANTPRLHRALDQLDLVASAAAIALARTLSPAHRGSGVFRYGEALHAMYSGNAELYLKEHALAPESPMAGHEPQVMGSTFSLTTMLSVATGALREAQALASKASRLDREHGLSRARVAFALGQHDVVDSFTSQVLITGTDPREKGAALALRAAALVRRGREAAALADVRNALDYCVVSGSVLPFALLPSDLRSYFVEMTVDFPQWEWIADTFAMSPVTGAQLRARLLDLPVTMSEARVENRLLDSHELDLLYRLEKATPLARIAADLSLAEGTVKNRLSAIYRKLGVRNRRDAVEYGYRNGYFS
ncbi:response regulator transcription factor [Brevibacterium sp. K72]|uniref:response regulator transcription factor n=1 Tax=Brevibacterium sp. K72 TaxID=3390729 RepID=UPI003D300A12